MDYYRAKEISWLSFNERVLQEAEKEEVPLIERFKFLGIYSNNLDEFFKVRVATLRRISELGQKAIKILGDEPSVIQKSVYEIVLSQREKYEEIHAKLIEEMAKENIYFVNEKDVEGKQKEFTLKYFHQKVRPKLMPIMVDQVPGLPELDDDAIYLATILSREEKQRKKYALIKVPSDELSRFLILPRNGEKKYIIFLDDVIRLGLSDLFHVQNYDKTEAYTIKVTKDAELDINDDLGESYVNKVAKGLKKREEGAAVRLVHDSQIPIFLLDHLKKILGIKNDDSVISGGRYHNLKDFMGMPNLGSEKLVFSSLPAIPHPSFKTSESIFEKIRKKDILLHFPYHSFDHFIDLLREASIDPKVKSLRMTIYRLANNSTVVSALLNALRNGKQVTVIVELTARFSEQSNIDYSKQLNDEGARVIYGVQGLKVHAKLCQIIRKEKGGDVYYSVLGTGNFNEETGRVFSDHLLLTCRKDLGTEVFSLFEFFRKNYKVGKYKYLVPSPFKLRAWLIKMIQTEISNANLGRPAYVHLKLNNLVDQEVIRLLLLADREGVEVKLNVRGMNSLVTPEANTNLEAIAIIDRFLEHSRIFFFCNNGEEQVFLSSADLMTRNLDRRVEVAFPILDVDHQKELRKVFDLQWADNTQARIWDKNLENKHRPITGRVHRSQIETYTYLMNK